MTSCTVGPAIHGCRRLSRRRLALAVAASLCLFSLSCGYIGPIVPPSPEIPNTVTDLSAVERGTKVEIHFSTPPRTTDNRAIKTFSKIDLAIGPANDWPQAAQHHDLPLPPANDPDAPLYQPMRTTEPASNWVGRKIAIAVRTAVKEKGHFSQWSNRVVLNVIPPLHPPTVAAKATAAGYHLIWQAERPGMHFDIYRQAPSDKQPVQIGTADKPEYLDTTSAWDTYYAYTVIALLGDAESLPSEPVRVIHSDTFPPAVPEGVAALATPESIDISWQRVPSANLKGYYLYRSIGGGSFERIGDLLTLPTYADHAVEHGKTYNYEVSSVSQKGYESAKSAATAKILFP